MKKIIALVLVAMFALSFVVGVNAQEIELYLDATVDTADEIAVPGTEVCITLNTDAAGYAGAVIWIYYDQNTFGLPTGVDDDIVAASGRNDPKLSLLASKDYPAQGKLGMTFGQAANITKTGKLVDIYFTTLADAVTGDYDFTVVCEQMGTASGDRIENDVTTNGITVRVKGADPQPAVSVDMAAATEDGNEVAANLYVNIPAGDTAADYTVSVNGTASTLGNDQKVSYAVAAKKMGDPITIEITKGSDTVYSGTTSVKAYCEAIAAGNYSDEVKHAASTMLVYGAAAQKYFNYNTDALVTDEVCAIPVAANRFDASGLRAALKDAPVEYTSINAQFLADTSLLIALKVKDASKVDEAREWVNNNVGLEGGSSISIMSNSNSGAKFIVITKSGITIDKVCDDFGIAVEGTVVGTISVANYLAAVEATYAGNAAKANFLELARALYAYAQAVECLA